VQPRFPRGICHQSCRWTNNGDGMADVLWEGRILGMFAIDVDVRGTEITETDRAYLRTSG